MSQMPIKEYLLGQNQKAQILEFVGNNREELILANKWHYIVYIESTSKLILHQSSSSSDIFGTGRNSFTQILDKIVNPSFQDLLYLCTLYPLLLPKSSDPIRHKEIDVSLPPSIQQLILAGNGYLLYYHQLEILYATITNCSHSEAVLFRRDWNLKKHYTREIAKSLYITNDITLYDLFQDASLNDNHFVYQANYHGAYNVYNLIYSY